MKKLALLVLLLGLASCAGPRYSKAIPSFCIPEARLCKYVHEWLGHEARIVNQEGTSHYYCEAKINGEWRAQILAVEHGKLVIKDQEND